MRKIIIISVLFVQFLLAQEECTIGVASGIATQDGRPLIWKTRDNSSARDNEIIRNTSYSIPYLEIITAGTTSAWMGLNEAGFAILNSLANDLPTTSGGFSNGTLMRSALGNCASIEEFETFLGDNDHGSTHGNFAVLDSSGAAAMFEISGTTYWKYDAADPMQSTNGYILRTNFAENGTLGSGSGHERYQRTSDLIHDFYEGDSLNYKSILRYQMRDFSDSDSNPVPVPFPDQWVSYRPYGYIFTDVSINRWSSVSATVIQGVLPGESELLSTMWAMLGSPAAAITVPYWPVGATPALANGSSSAPLCDISLDLRAELFDYAENASYIDSYKLLDGEGGGLWTDLFPVEDSIFIAGEEWLNTWRANGVNATEMLQVEQAYAQYAYDSMQDAYTELVSDIHETSPLVGKDFMLAQNYPNPFNSSTVIQFSIPVSGVATIKVYDILGQEVANLFEGQIQAGNQQVVWNTGINNKLSSGIYLCQVKLQTKDANFSDIIKINYIK